MNITPKERLSKFSLISTLLVYILMLGAAWSIARVSIWATAGLLLLTILMSLAGLYFMPLSISIDDEAVSLRFPLRMKMFRRSDIAGIKVYTGRRNFVRTFGSGGFLGHWGHFYNRELGAFFLYAASLDHLLFVEMKDGRKYLASCTDPHAIVAAMQG